MSGGDQLVEPAQDVVAGHQADAQLVVQADAAGHFDDRFGAATGIHPTGVGGHLDPLADDLGENSLHKRHEVAGIPRSCIP
jgi:hypothetical protein